MGRVSECVHVLGLKGTKEGAKARGLPIACCVFDVAKAQDMKTQHVSGAVSSVLILRRAWIAVIDRYEIPLEVAGSHSGIVRRTGRDHRFGVLQPGGLRRFGVH